MSKTNMNIKIKTTRGKYPFPENDTRIYNVSDETTVSSSQIDTESLESYTTIIPTAGYLYVAPTLRSKASGNTIYISDIEYEDTSNLSPGVLKNLLSRESKEKSTLNRQASFDDQMLQILNWTDKTMQMVKQPSSIDTPISHMFGSIKKITNKAEKLQELMDTLPDDVNTALTEGTDAAVNVLKTKVDNIQSAIEGVESLIPNNLENILKPLSDAKNPLSELPNMIKTLLVGDMEGPLADVMTGMIEDVAAAQVENIKTYIDDFYNRLFSEEGAPLKIMSSAMENIQHSLNAEGLNINLSPLENELNLMSSDLGSIQSAIGVGSNIFYTDKDGNITGIKLPRVEKELKNIPESFHSEADRIVNRVDALKSVMMGATGQGIKIRNLPDKTQWNTMMSNLENISNKLDNIEKSSTNLKLSTIGRMQSALSNLTEAQSTVEKVQSSDMPEAEMKKTIARLGDTIDVDAVKKVQTAEDVKQLMEHMTEAMHDKNTNLMSEIDNWSKLLSLSSEYLNEDNAVESNALDNIKNIRTGLDIDENDEWVNTILDKFVPTWMYQRQER